MIRLSNFQEFLFSVNYISGKSLKEFEIFDLRPICCVQLTISDAMLGFIYLLVFKIAGTSYPFCLSMFYFHLNFKFLVTKDPLLSQFSCERIPAGEKISKDYLSKCANIFLCLLIGSCWFWLQVLLKRLNFMLIII